MYGDVVNSTKCASLFACLLGFGAVGEEFVSTFISMLNPPLVTYCTQLSVEKASFSVNVYFLGREGEFLRNAKR